MRLAEDGELLALVIGKDDVGEKREQRRPDPEAQGQRRNPERRWNPPPQQRAQEC